MHTPSIGVTRTDIIAPVMIAENATSDTVGGRVGSARIKLVVNPCSPKSTELMIPVAKSGGVTPL